MKQSLIILLLSFLILLFATCNSPESNPIQNSTSKLIIENHAKEIVKDSLPKALGHGYDFLGNGKLKSQKLDTLFTKTELDTFQLPQISQELISGLKHQLKLLKLKKHQPKNSLGKLISKKQFQKTINILIANHSDSLRYKDELEAHQIWGEDKKGNVHFTGYFTPILEVSKKRTAEFQFPLYKYPTNWIGQLPTRKEIDGSGVLLGKGLEIAFAKSKLDIYFLQVQGSGLIEFQDGTKKMLAYAGSNKHPYRSIGKYMIEKGLTTKEHVSLKSIQKYFYKNPFQLDSILHINPSYIFFSPTDKPPQGAGNVPLTSNYSIAVDKNYIPLGSCLLAAVPILNQKRQFSHHEYRVLIAQDVGGAIKGPGHVDLYTGIGAEAKNAASNLHHYGRIWLLLPTQQK